MTKPIYTFQSKAMGTCALQNTYIIRHDGTPLIYVVADGMCFPDALAQDYAAWGGFNPALVSCNWVGSVIKAVPREEFVTEFNNKLKKVLDECENDQDLLEYLRPQLQKVYKLLNRTPQPKIPVQLRFVPQVWVNDYASPAAPLGPTEWFVDRSDIRFNFDRDHEQRDDLRHHVNAPSWLADWSGPFEVELIDPDALNSHEWRLLDEGPFETKEQAQEFIDAEVGIPAYPKESELFWYIESLQEIESGEIDETTATHD